MQKVRDDLIDKGLFYFDYYPDASKVFTTVAIDAGITITLFKNGYSGDIHYALNGEKKGVYNKDLKFFSDKFEEEAFRKLNPENFNGKTMNDRIIGNLGSLGGSEFGYSKTLHITELKETPDGMRKPLKIWANSGYGKGTRFSWHYIDTSKLKNVPERLLSTRKVMLDKKGHAATTGSGNIVNNQPIIVDKNVIASGDVFFVIPENDMDYELELIKSLFRTRTARFLMSIAQKDLYVRGLDNIPDYICFREMLDGGYFSDEWFYETFNFSDELKARIESIISKK